MNCGFPFCAEAQFLVAIGCLVFVAYCAGRNDWSREATRVKQQQQPVASVGPDTTTKSSTFKPSAAISLPVDTSSAELSTTTSPSAASQRSQAVQQRQDQMAQKPTPEELEERTSADCEEHGENSRQSSVAVHDDAGPRTPATACPIIGRLRAAESSLKKVDAPVESERMQASAQKSPSTGRTSSMDIQLADGPAGNQATSAPAVRMTFPSYPYAGSSVQSNFDPYARFMAEPYSPPMRGERSSAGALRSSLAVGKENKSSFLAIQHGRSAEPLPDPRPSIQSLHDGEGSCKGCSSRPFGSTSRNFPNQPMLDTRQRYRRRKPSPYPARQRTADHDESSDALPSSPSIVPPGSPSSASSSSGEPPSPESADDVLDDEYDQVDEVHSIPSSRGTNSSEDEGWNDLEDYDMINWYEATERERENEDGLPPQRSVLADAAIGFRDLLGRRRHSGI